jgi:hypothetical protein
MWAALTAGVETPVDCGEDPLAADAPSQPDAATHSRMAAQIGAQNDLITHTLGGAGEGAPSRLGNGA